jgi:small subunit ribosomal protein S9
MNKDAKRFYEGVGRRKTATARVRITLGAAAPVVNGRTFEEYFRVARYRQAALAPVTAIPLPEKVAVSAKVFGGGVRAQAEAVCHGLARALVKFDEGLKKQLRVSGFLTRDSRMVERKKYGLKKARRAPQWAKR